jgi:hypothetical protein
MKLPGKVNGRLLKIGEATAVPMIGLTNQLKVATYTSKSSYLATSPYDSPT